MISGLSSARGSQAAVDRNLTASSMASAGRVRVRTTPLLPETGHAVGSGVVPELDSVADDPPGQRRLRARPPLAPSIGPHGNSLAGNGLPREPAGGVCLARPGTRGEVIGAAPGCASRSCRRLAGFFAVSPRRPRKPRGEAKVAPAGQILRIASCLDSSLRRLGRYAIVPRKALRCGCRRIERA